MDRAQKVAGVIEQASAELGDHDQQTLASYTGEFANSIKSLADTLNTRSIDELGTDALSLARKRSYTVFTRQCGDRVCAVPFRKSLFRGARERKVCRRRDSRFEIGNAPPYNS